MRGKEADLGGATAYGRITPAYAGKSMPAMKIQRRLTDHPCVCGEKCTFCIHRETLLGSPLRMRGKGEDNPRRWKSRRITPAYAGKRL